MSDGEQGKGDEQAENGQGGAQNEQDGQQQPKSGDGSATGQRGDQGHEQGRGDAADEQGKAKGGGDGQEPGGDDWKSRSRTWETRAKANKEAADKATAEAAAATDLLSKVRQAFGLESDGENDDPKTVAERAQAAAAEKDAELRTLRIERAAERAARKAEVDPDALLDSRSFATAVAKLDPADAAFNDDLAELIKKTAESNPHIKIAKEKAGPSSTDMSDGGEGGGTGRQTIDDMRKAHRDRRAAS